MAKTPAITNSVKTYFTSYLAEETDGEVLKGTPFQALRVSSDGVAGQVEQIQSDVILPESRVKAANETGTESNSGDIATEWNADEQDGLLAAVMCGEWQDTPTEQGELSHKTLVLGDIKRTFSLLRKYPQKPVEYQLFKGERVNQLTMAMELSQFVKMTWGMMGNNHPTKSNSIPSPIAESDLKGALTTKAFKTLEGSIYMGESLDGLEQNRQVSALNVTINNNLESTNALFETEAIEQSLGDFVVSGSFDYWNSGDKARSLYNAGIQGKERYIVTSVWRRQGGKLTKYRITLHVHFDSSSEAKDGNKLKDTVNFTMVDAEGIKFEKITYEDQTAATPTFDVDLNASESKTVGEELVLSVRAESADGGRITYQWHKDGSPIDGASKASYTVSSLALSDAGKYKCVAVNSYDDDTASAESAVCDVTVQERVVETPEVTE